MIFNLAQAVKIQFQKTKEFVHDCLTIGGVSSGAFLFLFILISACNEPVNSHLPDESSNSHATENPVVLATQPAPERDPGFVPSQDTMATHGPRSITRNMLQDKRGNFWFASWEGIIHYDGKRFTNVTLMAGLKQYHVFSLLEDKAGNIWFGMIGGGVYRYRPGREDRIVQDDFTLFTTNDGLADNSILNMLEDREGNIWFGTRNGGVSRYNGQRFVNYNMKDGLSSNFVAAIAQDITGKLWFGTSDGINWHVPTAAVLPGGKLFTHFGMNKEKSFHNTQTIHVDKAGIMWFGSDEGFFRYDQNQQAMEKSVSGLRPGLTRIKMSAAKYIFEDHSGNLWLSSGEVNHPLMILYRYDPSSLSLVKIKEERQVFGITEDRSGHIWFGTEKGVQRFDPSALSGNSEKQFTTFAD